VPGFAPVPWPGLPLAPARESVHTELQATYPAADSLHSAAIREVRLRYSTAVQLDLSTVTVIGPEGVVRTVDTLRYVSGSGRRELRLPLPAALVSGPYRIEWRTAGPDGHALRGDFGFEVDYDPPPDEGATGAGADTGEARAPGVGASPGTQDDEPDLQAVSDTGQADGEGRVGAAVTRWLGYLLMLAGLGGAMFRSLVLPRVGSGADALDVRRAIEARMSVLAWIAIAAAGLALPAALGLRSVQTFGGDGLAASNLARVLGSGWGAAWTLQASAVALLAVGLLVARGRSPRWGWLLAGAAGVLMAVGVARAGHAVEGGAWTVAVLTLHACAAAVWAGGLAILVLGVLPATRKARTLLPRVVDAFSPVALTAVGILIATGVFNSWDRVGGPAALFGSTFGRVLLFKLLLFAGAAALGFHNWRTVRPALRADGRASLLRVPATMEMLLGLSVLAVTAVLVALPLP
jgi:copper transport protein